MAQELRFSQRQIVELVEGASNVLDFLQDVDTFSCLYAGPILQNAIRRYEVFWLPLAAGQGRESRSLAAPLDIAWVWHVHMLAPHHHEQDCLNIVSQVIDHTPMNIYQRLEGRQTARYLWEASYPREQFEVDLTQPLPFLVLYKTKIRYDLERACYNHAKFYYQISLPHYADRKLLTNAIERYEKHLELKSRNPYISMMPGYDVDLIWRTHQLHPLNYKQVTTELFGIMVQRDENEASVNLGSKSDYLETSTRAVWEEADLQFGRAGAMYIGEPPPRRPPRPDWLYAPLAQLKYVLNILKVEVFNSDATKTFYVRLNGPNGRLILKQRYIHVGVGVDLWNRCTLDNEKKHKITVSLHQRVLLRTKTIGTCKTSLMSYLDSVRVGGPTSANPWIINVPFSGSQIVVRFTVTLGLPNVEGYRFTIQQETFFTKLDHPLIAFNFPQVMYTPSDLAKPYLPCEVATHTLLDVREREAFKCSVVHSTVAVLSAFEVIRLYNDTVASVKTITSAVLPEEGSLDSRETCVPLNQKEGERAMLIQGRRDWGICIGKWKKGTCLKRSAGQVEIKFFSLDLTKDWCEVRKYKGGLYLIYIDSNNYLYID